MSMDDEEFKKNATSYRRYLGSLIDDSQKGWEIISDYIF